MYIRSDTIRSDTMKPKLFWIQIWWFDFPHNTRIRFAQLKTFLLHPDVAKSLPCWLSQFSFSKLRQPTGQRLSNIRMQQTKISIVTILFLPYVLWGKSGVIKFELIYIQGVPSISTQFRFQFLIFLIVLSKKYNLQ